MRQHVLSIYPGALQSVPPAPVIQFLNRHIAVHVAQPVTSVGPEGRNVTGREVEVVLDHAEIRGPGDPDPAFEAR
jgi:hypothetical protein